MTILILGSLIAGLLCGYAVPIIQTMTFLPVLTDWALAILLFTVGYDLAADGNLGEKIKGLPKIALAVPLLIALGSLCGAAVTSLFVLLPVNEGLLVGSGFGWYSLSAVIISQSYDVTIGALALLANVLREVLAIIITPFLARRLGFLPAVAPGGATTMDVTLPIIAKSTDARTTLVAFYSGSVLSASIPFIVPFLIKLILN